MFDAQSWTTVEGFRRTFGEPKEAMLMDMSQEFMTAYHKSWINEVDLVDGFGLDWLELLLDYNERNEEYELCSIYKEVITNHKRLEKNKETNGKTI